MLSKFFKRFISEETAEQSESAPAMVKQTNGHIVQPVEKFQSSKLSYHEQTRLVLQSQFDNSSPGQVIKLTPQEYLGPFFINQPLILEGQNATLWTHKGPVLFINSPNVMIKNINIEVTGDIFVQPEEECAICIKESYPIHFEQLQVRGQIIGMKGEIGQWQYPYSLHLGKLTHDTVFSKILIISVPIPCHFESAISGVQVTPTSLVPGINEVQIRIEPLSEDISLHGNLYLKTDQLKRRIYLTGHISSSQNLNQPRAPQILWFPPNWQASKQNLLQKQEMVPENLEPQWHSSFTPQQHFSLAPPVDTDTHLKRLKNSVFFKQTVKEENLWQDEESATIKKMRNNERDNIFLKSVRDK